MEPAHPNVRQRFVSSQGEQVETKTKRDEVHFSPWTEVLRTGHLFILDCQSVV